MQRDRKYILTQESQLIEELDVRQYDEEELCGQLRNDLRRLFREADGKKDPLSSKIVADIDQWLKSELKMAIEKQEYL